MQYADLSDEAKKNAVRLWREDEANHPDHGWWDYTYTYAVTVGKVIGIEIGTRTVKTVKGATYEETDIEFSGFCCQGDGASFSGQLNVAGMKNCVERLKEEIGEDEKLVDLAEQAEALYTLIWMHEVAERLAPSEDAGWYECTTTSQFQIDRRPNCGNPRVDGESLPLSIENAANALVGNFASWIYHQLEAEHDHLTSEEYAIDDINNSDAEFDENGNPE